MINIKAAQLCGFCIFENMKRIKSRQFNILQIKNYNFLLVILFVGLLSACKTYYIPVSSFKAQFAGLDSSKLKTVNTRSPFGGVAEYKTYPINVIECFDKKGNKFSLANGPAIEIRFTDTNNKKTVFFFDLMRVTDSTVTGSMSRIIPSLRKTIKLGAIKKIEVQNGGKKYQYIN